MKTRNITLNLPVDLLRRAKVYAAQRDSSVSTLVRESLEAQIGGIEESQMAFKRVLALAKQGPLSTVDPASITRDQLYED